MMWYQKSNQSKMSNLKEFYDYWTKELPVFFNLNDNIHVQQKQKYKILVVFRIGHVNVKFTMVVYGRKFHAILENLIYLFMAQ